MDHKEVEKFLGILTLWLFITAGLQLALGLIVWRMNYKLFMYNPLEVTPEYILNIQHIFKRATYIGYISLVVFWIANWKRLSKRLKEQSDFLNKYMKEDDEVKKDGN